MGGERMKLIFISGMFAGEWIWEEVLKEVSCEKVFVQKDPLSKISGDINEIVGGLKEKIIKNQQACILVGNSLGGLIASLLALDNPEYVKGIVLSGSPGMGTTNLGIGLPKEEIWFERLKEKLFVNPDLITDDQLDLVKECFKNRKTLKNIARLSRASNKTDIRELLDIIKCPVLLLWGEQDEVSPKRPWIDYAKENPRTEMFIIPKSGHSPMLEKPHEFTLYLNEFIEKVGNSYE